MRPVKLLSTLSLLLYLPLYAQETPSTVPPIEEPLVQEPIQPTIAEVTPTPNSEVETAQPTAEPTQASTIEALIKTVQTAPDNQKRVLMNQLKVQLKTMNKESRHQAMMKLKQSFTKHQQQGDKLQTHQQQPNHESCQHGNHQPKFRHLRQGPQDGSGPHRGEGQGGGAGHQGEGGK